MLEGQWQAMSISIQWGLGPPIIFSRDLLRDRGGVDSCVAAVPALVIWLTESKSLFLCNKHFKYK